MKVLTILGTRPEAIKLAPVILELSKHHEIESKVCVTAQHRSMLDQVLAQFNIEPDWDLDLMSPNQSLFELTARILQGLEAVVTAENPDVVIVQGDTTTALVGALAAYYSQKSVAHVEAGLRTHNKHNPFPEELNRKLTDAIADVFFAPTERAKQNLLDEGILEQFISITGNTVIDALLNVTAQQKDPDEQEKFRKFFASEHDIELGEKRMILVTGHRRESFGSDIKNICNALKRIAEQNSDIELIYPVHLNPNVQKPVYGILGNVRNIRLIPPLEYASFVWLLSQSYLVLTDSGGIQEEAPSLGKPVLVTRKSTERPEAIEAGVAKLVGTDAENIVAEVQRLLDDSEAYAKMARVQNPFGDGHASERIVEVLLAKRDN